MKQPSLEVRVDDVDELIRSLDARIIRASPGQMLPHVVLENLRKQAVHCAARRGEEVHDLGAVPRAFESALHGLHLPADAPDTVKQLLLFTNGVSHKILSLIV